MGYMHIENLYRNREIMFQLREAYALEKIHGSSAHILHNDAGNLLFFSGGESQQRFEAIFDKEALKEKLRGVSGYVYGEVYGGKCQGMSETYGKELRFVAFDVQINKIWLDVPKAEAFVKELGLEFVHYERIPMEMEHVTRCMEEHSIQAIRNGMGEGKQREGIVLRPIFELTDQYGGRVMSKHKAEKFRETKTPRPVDAGKQAIYENAKAIADEYVTEMRLTHVLDKFPGAESKDIPQIIKAMCEDVQREGSGELVWSKEVAAAVGKATSTMFIQRLKSALTPTE